MVRVVSAFAFGTLVISAALSSAQDSPPMFPGDPKDRPGASQSPPPRFVTVTDVRPTEGAFTFQETGYVPVEMKREVVKGERVEVETLIHWKVEFWSITAAQGTIRLMDAEGMEVPKDKVTKRLVKGATILLSADGKPVSPEYLKLLKKKTMILILPPSVKDPGPAPNVG